MKIQLSIDDFKDIMAVCAKHTGMDRSRRILSYICIRVFSFGSQGKIEATGMNSYTMATRYCECKVLDTTEEESREIYHEILIDPIKIPSGVGSTVQISDTNSVPGTVKLVFDNGVEMVQTAKNDPYINYQRVV